MADEDFVDVKYSSGLSSRDSFVMEPAESSPIINSQKVETDKITNQDNDDKKEVKDETLPVSEQATNEPDRADKKSPTLEPGQQPPWSGWGSALISVASSSVKAFEHGVAKVLDVIDDDNGKEGSTYASGPLRSDGLVTSVEGESMLPSGMKDDLRMFSSAVQKTSGKIVNTGFNVLTTLSKKTFEVLVAEEESSESAPVNTSTLSSRLREAQAENLKHEKEQKQQLLYWFDQSGGNDTFEAFRCFSQSSLHSIHGKIELCKGQTTTDQCVPESYKKIADILSASSDRLIRDWDSAGFAKSDKEGDFFDDKAFHSLLKERFSLLTAPIDRMCSAVEKARKDLLAQDMSQNKAFEVTLESMANFTAASLDFLHKNVQLFHASALSVNTVERQPTKENFIQTECSSVLELTEAFAEACLVFAVRIRAISLAGKAAVLKTISEATVQPDDDSSPELAATTLDMEATDCAAHLAKTLAFLSPVLQHLLLLRIYGADCRPSNTSDEEN